MTGRAPEFVSSAAATDPAESLVFELSAGPMAGPGARRELLAGNGPNAGPDAVVRVELGYEL
jgi:hypothetical protein